MHMADDLEYEIMKHCLKTKGKWWANHLFYNKEVGVEFSRIRCLELSAVFNELRKGE